MQYKRRNVRVYRDFPKGCGVICRKSNVGESLMPLKFKAYGVLPHITKALETETTTIKGLCNWRDGSLTDEPSLESDGDFEDLEEDEVTGKREAKRNWTSPVKKRRLSLHNSTMEVEKDVVNTSKRVIVSGLAAHSKCPWTQPKNKSSKKEQRRYIL